MKVDIKSFLIGILTTVNLFLLMGFDDHEEENEIGRYQSIIVQNKSDSDVYVMDTTNGQLVKFMNLDNVFQEAEDNYGQIKGGVKF
jgi:hypothetical protein